MRRLLIWTGTVLGLALIAVAAGMLIPRPLFESDRPDARTVRILVLSNPIHTDIAIPLDGKVAARFAFLRDAGVPIDSPDAKWLIIGWGGRAFYIATPTWADLQLVPLVKGLTVDASVLHVEAYGDIRIPQPQIAPFDISDVAFDRMLDVIDQTFARDAGNVQPIADSAYGTADAFFEANGLFSAIVGCNTWTAYALRSAGVRTGWWNPFPQSLGVSLDLYNADSVLPGGRQP